MVEAERPQMTTRRRVACWICKATRTQTYVRPCATTPLTHTHTHIEICNTVCFSTPTIISEKPLIVTLYVHYVVFLATTILFCVGRNSSVGTATRSGNRIAVEARFSALVQTGPGAQRAFYKRVPDVFTGGKAARAWS